MSIQWLFEGEPEEADGLVYYTRIRARFPTGSSTRIFRIGECVRIDAGDPNQEWIGQIVELYDRGPSKDPEKFRNCVVLRWMYHPHDIPFWNPNERNGMYFSDHVDLNPVEVISGRAFLFDDKEHVRGLQKKLSEKQRIANIWPDDKIVLVQYYYQTGTKNPPPIRRLEEGELDYLLNNPTAEPMYFSFRNGRPKKSFVKSHVRSKAVLSLKAASDNGNRRKQASVPDRPTELRVTNDTRPSPSASKGFKRKSDLTSRKNAAQREIQPGKPSERLQNAASKRTSTELTRKQKDIPIPRKEHAVGKRTSNELLMKQKDIPIPRKEHVVSKRTSNELFMKQRDIPIPRKEQRTQNKKPQQSGIPRKRREPIGDRSVSPVKKVPRSPSSQVILEDTGSKNQELSEERAFQDMFSFRRKGGSVNEATVAPSKSGNASKNGLISNHGQVHRSQMEVDTEIPDTVMGVPLEDLMDVEPPQNKASTPEDVHAELVSSFEQLSRKQREYALRNLKTHVELISRRVGERGLDLKEMKDEEKRALAKEITSELMDL